MPVVSIVIPCFNLGAYLPEAVESVLAQTYQDLEIIIIDDGSTDPATCALFSSFRRPKTRVIRCENGGLARARNLGLGEAQGEYVSFLDADDLFAPTFLERSVEVLSKAPSLAFASCWLKAFGASDFEWVPATCDFPHLLAEDTVCTAALTRRDALLKVGGYDTNMVLGYQDWDLAIRLVGNGCRGLIIPDFLFLYRIRSGSMSQSSMKPLNHALTMEYLVNKHESVYCRHYAGVLDVISERIKAVEKQLAHPPPRPEVSKGAGELDVFWKESLLTLEMHRRNVEFLVQNPADSAVLATDRSTEVLGVRMSPVDSNLLGGHIDGPKPGDNVSINSLRIAGWALGRSQSVVGFEVLISGTSLLSVKPNVLRPDLTAAFPNVPGAERAGFETSLSLAGAPGEIELEIRTVLEDETLCSVGWVKVRRARRRDPAETVSLLLPSDVSSSTVDSALAQEWSEIELLTLAPGPASDARLAKKFPPWTRVLPLEEGCWFEQGARMVTSEFFCILESSAKLPPPFITQAVNAFKQNQKIGFVCSSAKGSPSDIAARFCLLPGVLNGREITFPIIFRSSAVKDSYGFDATFLDPKASQWDLCIRLIKRDYLGVAIPIQNEQPDERSNRVQDPQCVSRISRNHADLFEAHLIEVLLDQENRIGQLLRENHALERQIGRLRPELELHKSELQRLELRNSEMAAGARPSARGSSEPFNWGEFRRLSPFSPNWGSERGLCIDRAYIEPFLERHADDVRGRVLEIHNSVYTYRYGGLRVAAADILDVDPLNPRATIVADLCHANSIPDATYDCIILTQTLCLISDVAAALRECRRILKPGGVLLSTEPCLNRIDSDAGLDGDFWRFTPAGLEELFKETFGEGTFLVEAHGNRLASLAFLHGLAAHEIPGHELFTVDPSSPLTVTVRAVVPTALT